MCQIRNEVGDSYIWISVDETTDINGRFIANLIIGVLQLEKPTCSYLDYCHVKNMVKQTIPQ